MKTAKLCVKQDQIGRYKTLNLTVQGLKERLALSLRVRSLERFSNEAPRGMVVESHKEIVVIMRGTELGLS